MSPCVINKQLTVNYQYNLNDLVSDGELNNVMMKIWSYGDNGGDQPYQASKKL